MDLDERIANLAAATAHGTTIEQELLRARVLAIGPHLTQNPGSSAPPLVVLETRRSAFFKRFVDQKVRICQQYRQDPYDVPLNEVVAWRLAEAMGPPWIQLVTTSVLRVIEGRGGALINDRVGVVDLGTVINNAPEQAADAGFWDALIGNQDRNARNFRYDPRSNRLALIDHGFVFARRGDPINTSSLFSAYRRSVNRVSVTAKERAALSLLLESGDLHGLRRFLPADRCDALEARASEMLRTGCLPAINRF